MSVGLFMLHIVRPKLTKKVILGGTLFSMQRLAYVENRALRVASKVSTAFISPMVPMETRSS